MSSMGAENESWAGFMFKMALAERLRGFRTIKKTVDQIRSFLVKASKIWTVTMSKTGILVRCLEHVLELELQ